MSAMCWGWGAILVILGVSGAHIANGEESQDECRMPGSWTGFWFLSGKPELIAITNQSLGWLGTCHAKQGNNKYVLHRRRDQCYQCLAIWPRHDNVIEFKAGECTDTEEADLETLCEISPDVTLNTLVRQREIDEPIECPFQGPVSFSYDKGTGLCSSPLSELTQCMTKSQLKLRYHACPDIDQTESREEILTCLATWPDDRDASQTFLVAKLEDHYRRTREDRLRCFLLSKIDSGFLVAQSTDATCHGGLISPTEGFQTFQLGLPAQLDTENLFPDWASQHQRMLTFDFAHLYSFSDNGESFTVSNFTYATKKTVLASQTTIMKTLMTGDNWAKLIIKSVSGCEQSYQCAILHKRTDDILELEVGRMTKVLRAACAHSYFEPGANEMITLLTENLGNQECPLTGVHNVTSLSLDTQTDLCERDPMGFSRLESHCSSPQQVQFIRDCPLAADRATYICQGGWEEIGDSSQLTQPTTDPFPFSESKKEIQEDSGEPTVGFLIAKPVQINSKAHRRVCLMYTVINETYVWTVGKKGCNRLLGLSSQSGGYTFTTAFTGACTDGATSTVNSYLVMSLCTIASVLCTIALFPYSH